MELTQEPANTSQSAMSSVIRERHLHYPADVLDYVTSLGIEPERPWCPVVPDIVQMAQEGMYRRGPWSRRSAHRVTDTHYPAAHIAALKRPLGRRVGGHARTVPPSEQPARRSRGTR